VIEKSFLELKNLIFRWKKNEPEILNISSFKLTQGQKIFLHGPSGSGKTTFLGILGGVLSPQVGEVQLLGHSLSAMSAAEKDQFRADHIGFIFQQFNLLPYLSVLENVKLSCAFSGHRKDKIKKNNSNIDIEALRLLASMGIQEESLLKRNVVELSVGQQQRVAVARALMGAPELIIADEPTSALDYDARGSFIELLMKECLRNQSTLIFVSHDQTLSEKFDQSISLSEINLRST